MSFSWPDDQFVAFIQPFLTYVTESFFLLLQKKLSLSFPKSYVIHFPIAVGLKELQFMHSDLCFESLFLKDTGVKMRAMELRGGAHFKINRTVIKCSNVWYLV